jgi:hypothetical protein
MGTFTIVRLPYRATVSLFVRGSVRASSTITGRTAIASSSSIASAPRGTVGKRAAISATGPVAARMRTTSGDSGSNDAIHAAR